MNFVSYRELKKDVVEWSTRLPEFDAIVGVERSGLLPATILALHLNKPLLTVNDLVYGLDKYIDSKVSIGEIEKVLVVDDSISSGRAITKIKEALKGYSAKYGVVYGLPESRNLVDYMYKEVPLPRAFEWNLFHNEVLRDAVLDIDGVIFEEPPLEDNKQEYEEYLANPLPLYIPTVKVRGLVTGRLEKYRDITEITLKRYNIRYDFLVMANYSTPQQRRVEDMGVAKANIYKTQGSLFIESSKQQADTIRKETGKEVICIEEL